MIYIIITSYGEVSSTEKAINSILEQKIKKPFKIIVSDPFDETKWMIEEKFKKKVEYFQDQDKGKSYALNMLLKKFYSDTKNDILIFTDGDVYLGKNSINVILKKFEDEKIGCVCGKPTTLNSRNNIFGYWSHGFFDEMNKTRKEHAKNKEFFEVSGYLFAIRNGIIKEFPMATSEDNIIPILIWQKGYKIDYAEDAEVYVLNPSNFKEWVMQKKRNIKGHIALKKNVNFSTKRVTIFGETIRGIKLLFNHPRNIKEFFWFVAMAFGRLYAWILAIYEVKIKKKQYKDGWREEENLTTTRLD